MKSCVYLQRKDGRFRGNNRGTDMSRERIWRERFEELSNGKENQNEATREQGHV